jgi:hypothetical protein
MGSVILGCVEKLKQAHAGCVDAAPLGFSSRLRPGYVAGVSVIW